MESRLGRVVQIIAVGLVVLLVLYFLIPALG